MEFNLYYKPKINISSGSYTDCGSYTTMEIKT